MAHDLEVMRSLHLFPLAPALTLALAIAAAPAPARADSIKKADTSDAPVAASAAVVVALAGETSGRVLVREGGDGRYRGRAAPGFELHAGDAVLSGPGARMEWLVGPDGRWRLGERAVWIAGATPGEATLRAGTALAAIPAGTSWRVRSADAEVSLSTGVWLLTAVENEGLKIVALDRGTATLPPPVGEVAGTAGSPAPDTLLLRAGEVVFAPPGGRAFGPVVTVFLDELLASSRLVTRFAAPLPQAERLRQQGAAQRERLALISNVHVGGARDTAGFQLLRVADPAAPASPETSQETPPPPK